jgi:hypothetical protein
MGVAFNCLYAVVDHGQRRLDEPFSLSPPNLGYPVNALLRLKIGSPVKFVAGGQLNCSNVPLGLGANRTKRDLSEPKYSDR